MTLKDRVVEEIRAVELDPREVSRMLKGSRDAEEFLERIRNHSAYWESSCVAQHFVAKAHFRDDDILGARQHLELARERWTVAGEIGRISRAAYEFITTSLVICDCVLSTAEGTDPRVALSDQRQAIEASDAFTASDIAEEVARIDQFIGTCGAATSPERAEFVIA